MRKIAIIVQRCGEEIVGGSEAYAFAMAKALSEDFVVDILSTTAKDYLTWKNDYSEGDVKLSQNLKIKRFKVDIGRETYWFELNGILMKNVPLDLFSVLPGKQRDTLIDHIRRVPFGFGEEWIKHQGPYPMGLFDYISKNNQTYDFFIFMTYLYPTTYYGIDWVLDVRKVFIAPTYHNEPPAYLPNFLKYTRYKHLFLTNAEKELADKCLYKNSVKYNIIGFGIKDRYEEIDSLTQSSRKDYILYAGRLEEAKGVLHLFKIFEQYYLENRNIKLYTIGEGNLKNYKCPGIVYKGYVSEEEKLKLMKNALSLVHPSAFESLGIVLLESFMMGTPAIVNKRSDVLDGHIINSKAGFSYEQYDDFREALNQMIHDKNLYDNLRKNARDYFLETCSPKAYKKRLLSITK